MKTHRVLDVVGVGGAPDGCQDLRMRDDAAGVAPLLGTKPNRGRV